MDELNRVVDAAEHSALSDRLGVSTALYLGATDMLKLLAMLEQPDDQTHALRVLRRLSTVPMTAQLESTTGFLAFLVEQSTDPRLEAAIEAGVEEAVQVATLAASIVRVWEAQLVEERRQWEAQQRKAQTPAAEKCVKKKKDPNCRACQGAHRAHTCK